MRLLLFTMYTFSDFMFVIISPRIGEKTLITHTDYTVCVINVFFPYSGTDYGTYVLW